MRGYKVVIRLSDSEIVSERFEEDDFNFYPALDGSPIRHRDRGEQLLRHGRLLQVVSSTPQLWHMMPLGGVHPISTPYRSDARA